MVHLLLKFFQAASLIATSRTMLAEDPKQTAERTELVLAVLESMPTPSNENDNGNQNVARP